MACYKTDVLSCFFLFIISRHRKSNLKFSFYPTGCVLAEWYSDAQRVPNSHKWRLESVQTGTRYTNVQLAQLEKKPLSMSEMCQEFC